MDVEEFKHRLIDETIQQYRRIGKYLIFECSRGIWVAHLRMEGKFYIYSQPHPKDKHTHVIFQLADGRQLHYHDTRKFGKMAFYYFDEEKTMLKNIGLDVFDEHLDALQLYRQWHQRKIRLKAMLLINLLWQVSGTSMQMKSASAAIYIRQAGFTVCHARILSRFCSMLEELWKVLSEVVVRPFVPIRHPCRSVDVFSFI